MKKNDLKLKLCIVATALFLTLPMMALGESSGIGTKTFSIGPRASFSKPKDADKGQWFVGAQARMHLLSSLALEGSIDYRRNDFGGNTTTIKTYPVQASLLAYLMPEAVLSPFLVGGVGWYYTRVEGVNNYSSTSHRFGLHAGAGVEFILNEYLSLDGSYRYLWLEKVTSKDINSREINYEDNGAMVTIGLNFLF